MIARFAKAPANAGLTAFVLRMMLGFFFLAHLYKKFFTMDGFWGWWGALTHRYPPFVPAYVLSVELLCAICLPLGLQTRLVALYALPSFVGIIAFWFGMGGYWFTAPGAEFPIMWMCLLGLQIMLGDGAYSVQFSQGKRQNG
jgi:putative oxidoreductase